MIKINPKLSALLLAGFLLMLASCAKDPDVEQPNKPDIAHFDEAMVEKGHICVKLTPELEANTAADLNKLAQLLGAIRVERSFPHGGKFESRMRQSGLHLWYEVYFDTAEPTKGMLSRASGLSGVQIVEPSYIIKKTDNPQAIEASSRASLIPNSISSRMAVFNDPMLSQQWHYQNDGSLGSDFKAGSDINLFPAWELETGKPEVVVAIIEGGVDITHPDLAPNMWINRAEANGVAGVDDDNNGYIDDIHGWNFYSDTLLITFSDHATHVAGTVAAVNNNGIGVAGVAGGNGSPNSGVRLITCQIATPEQVYVTGEKMKQAFVYAANNGAVIAQCSWGFSPGAPLPQSDKEAIDYFIDNAGIDENGAVVGPIKGGIAIFAAGNSGSNALTYPAAMPRVLAVASMGHNYIVPQSSNYGSHIGVVAPGASGSDPSAAWIWSTGVGNRYICMTGTSMACPHVSGVAALVISKFGVGYPGLTNTMVVDIIKRSAHAEIYTYNPSYIFLGEKRLGSGYVDAYRALLEAVDLVAVDDLAAKWGVTSAILSWTVPVNKYKQKPLKYILLYSTTSLDGIDPANIPQNVKQITIDGANKNEGDAMQLEISDLAKATTYYVGTIAEYTGGKRSAIYSVSGKTSRDGIKLYPNPVEKMLNVKADKNISTMKLSIYSSTGSEVYSTAISNLTAYDSKAIDVSKLVGGTYRVVMQYNGEEATRNIIKR